VVTKSECELVLPPRHKVYRVKEVKWISIGIGYPVLQTKSEEKQLEKLKSFPIADLHFYCESYDLTRPYPSKFAPHDYDEEFAWNHHLARPFHEVGLKEWTVVLLQGLAVGKVVKHQDKNVFIALLCKRSAWNPGTRYNARGLNEKLAPGNEYEVEQLCWVTAPDKTIKYSNVIWRRGTVPIHWKSEITNAVSDANIIIAKDPFKNIELYYQRIMDKYGSLPMICLDLLRSKVAHPEEDRLSQHYQQSLTILKTMMNIDIDHVRYDWHHQYKMEGLNRAVDSLWTMLGGKLKQFGVTTGEMKVGSGTQILEHRLTERQRGMLRVNCADSLDRTNLVSFFNGLHIVAEQLRSIGVDIVEGTDTPQRPWATLDLSLEEVNTKYPSILLLKFAEMYIQCGDICATLYTNTGAMHTKAMREYASHLPSARSNTQLIVERRYHNMFNDQARQSQYDMFLGVNWDKYFPSHVKHLRYGEIRYVSHGPSFIFKHVPSQFEGMQITEEQNLLHKTTNHIWVCPRDQSVVSVDINLPYYCRVTELAITIRHGDNWETSPAKMDVYVGEHYDDSILAFQQLQLPRCKDQTKLLFPLPPQISGNISRTSVYDFSGKKARPRMRCLKVTFYDVPQGCCMTLGQIQVFGVLPNNEKTSLQFFKELQQMSTSQSLQQAVVALEQREQDKKRRTSVKRQSTIPVGSSDEENLKENGEESESDTDNITDSHSTVSDAEEQEHPGREMDADVPDQHDHADEDEDEEVITKEEEEQTISMDISPQDEPAIDIPIEDVVVEEHAEADDEVPGLRTEDEEKRAHRDTITSDEQHSDSNNPNSSTTTNMTESVLEDYLDLNEDTNLKNFLNQVISKQQMSPLDPEASQNFYQQFVSEVCPKDRSSRLTFTETLELELARLALNLSPAQRDSILVDSGFKIAKFNPNLFVYHRDPKIEKTKRNQEKSSHCHMCNSSTKLRKFSCHYCKHSFCKKCISKVKFPIREYAWKIPQQVCIECASSIQRQEVLLEEIVHHLRHQEEQQTRDLTYENIFTELYPPVSTKYRNYFKDVKETYASEFPIANILGRVATDLQSAPIESILFPTDILPDKYWYAPKGVESANIIIALPAHILLSRLVLVVDSQGYTSDDVPRIQVSSYERIPHQVNHGDWIFMNKEILASTPATPTGESQRVVQPKQELEYTIPIRSVARMVQLTVTFQNPKQSFVDRRLHMGRILVYGKVVDKKPIFTPFTNEHDAQMYKEILSKKSTLHRSYIKTEARLSKVTHTMDLYKPSNIPVAGFQITVKHGTRFGILSQVRDIRVSVLYQNEKKEVESQEIVSHYVIPKVEDATSLIYDFKKRYENVSAVRFQYMSSQGAPEMSLPMTVLYDSRQE